MDEFKKMAIEHTINMELINFYSEYNKVIGKLKDSSEYLAKTSDIFENTFRRLKSLFTELIKEDNE